MEWLINWLVQVLIWGFAALLFFIASLVFACRKDYSRGRLFGILELVAASISSGIWAYALRVSGKADWSLLGFRRDPLISLIFWGMLAAGVLCLAINGFGLSRKRKSAQA